MDKMPFVVQTAVNVSIQLHSSLQKVYSREADNTLVFYVKILYIIYFHDDLIKCSASCLDNFLQGKTCQIPYNYIFVRFLPYYSLWKPSPANETVLGIPTWTVFSCLLDSVELFFSVIWSMHSTRLSCFKFQTRCIKKEGCFLQI